MGSKYMLPQKSKVHGFSNPKNNFDLNIITGNCGTLALVCKKPGKTCDFEK